MAEDTNEGRLLFTMPVTEMLDKAGAIVSAMRDDLAALQAVDPEITTAYTDTLEADIDAGWRAEGPERLRLFVAVEREKMEAKVSGLGQRYQELLFYVGRAYTDARTGYEVYGRPQYSVARRSAARVLPFMENVQRQMLQDAPELLAKGLTQAKIDAFGVELAAALELSGNVAGMQSRNAVGRQQYVDALNSIWRRISSVCQAAKLAFSTDWGRWQLYRLHGGKTRKETAFNMELPASGTAAHRLHKVPKPETIIECKILEGTGTAEVCFSPAKTPPGETVWQPVSPGSILKLPYSEIGSAGLYFIVRLVSGKVEKVRVRVRRNG